MLSLEFYDINQILKENISDLSMKFVKYHNKKGTA